MNDLLYTGLAINHQATGRLVLSEVIFSRLIVTRVMHTARISKLKA